MPARFTFRDWIMSRKITKDQRGLIVEMLQDHERSGLCSWNRFNARFENRIKCDLPMEGYDALREEWAEVVERAKKSNYSVRKYRPKRADKPANPTKPERPKHQPRPVHLRERAVSSARKRLSKEKGVIIAETPYLKALKSLGFPL